MYLLVQVKIDTGFHFPDFPRKEKKMKYFLNIVAITTAYYIPTLAQLHGSVGHAVGIIVIGGIGGFMISKIR